MKKLYLYFLIFLLLASLASALTLECFDDGSAKIDGLKKKWPVSTREKSSSGNYFEVPGKYVYNEKAKNYLFYSDEGIFISQKGTKYTVKVGKYKSTLTCPPFKFSCRIFNISIDYCYTRNETFISKFMVYNFRFNLTKVLRFDQPFMLRYEVTTEDNKPFVHGPDVYSPAFKNISITLRKLNEGNKYFFQWATEEKIKSFVVRYDKCRQEKYNFYTSHQCTEAAVCAIGKDCFEEEQCQKGLCEKLECEECQYISNHSCQNYSCCLDDDCQDTEACQEHLCLKLNCSQDEFIQGHQCQKLECLDNEITVNHACQKLQCAENEFVINHTCQKLVCSGKEYIAGHACQKLKCGLMKKSVEHQCISRFDYWKRKIIK